MKYVPDWWQLTLIVLASSRVWRLLAEDTLVDRPRRWLLRIGPDWQEEGDQLPEDFREGWAKFVTCPWCLGAWTVVAWWVAWLAFGDWALVAATPWAASALVGVIGAYVSSE